MSEGNPFQRLAKPLSFMLMFWLVLAYLPVGFTAQDSDYGINVPTEYMGLNLGAYAYSSNFTVNDADLSETFLVYRYRVWDLGGRRWQFQDLEDNHIMIGRRRYLPMVLFNLWIGTDFCNFYFENTKDRGSVLTSREMNLDYVEGEDWIKYRVVLSSDPAVACDLFIGFNTSEYSTPQEAYEDDNLKVVQSMGLSDAETSLNIWNLLGAVLLFRIPDIHPIISVMIGVPLWISFVWVAFYVLKELLPF